MVVVTTSCAGDVQASADWFILENVTPFVLVLADLPRKSFVDKNPWIVIAALVAAVGIAIAIAVVRRKK